MAFATSCIFCKIRDGALAAKKLYEDEQAIAFEDINPQAPTHVLVIPRKHIATLSDIGPEDEPLIGHLVRVASGLARERGHAGKGFRLVANCEREAGQTIFHIHIHLLGGRPLGWPPG
jgi:histidine triad (HIT) family protein